MLAEMMRIAPIEALRLCKGAEARFGQQHAARKNIRLDEIGAGCIAIEYGVIDADILRSEEHTSELQSLMRISYAVFCLKKKTQDKNKHTSHTIKTEPKS